MSLQWRSIAATVLLSLSAVAIFASPSLTAAMQFDRAEVVAAPWRLLTGHWTHWGAEHLFWDVAMFALLAGLLEHRGRWLMLACLAVSITAIDVALWWYPDRVTTYRGLSGIDSALFATAIAVLWREASRGGDRPRAALLGALSVGFVGKVGYETITGTTLFVDAAEFESLPVVHAVGAAAGLLVFSLDCWLNAPPASSSATRRSTTTATLCVRDR